MLQQAEQLAATEEAWMLHNAVQASLQDGPGQGQWGSGDVEEQLLQAGLRKSLREQEAQARQGWRTCSSSSGSRHMGVTAWKTAGRPSANRGSPATSGRVTTEQAGMINVLRWYLL